MPFRIQRNERLAIVEVDGQLVVSNRLELRRAVLEALESGARKFLIDFEKTGYIDSSGLAILVDLAGKIKEHGGEIRLANLNEDLRRLFELTRLEVLFTIADSREAGLQEL